VSGGVPPAFRGRKGTSFVGMHDDQVVKVAASALHMAQLLPAGSSTHAAQWATFDSAMGELGSRAIVHALQKIHEHQQHLEQGSSTELEAGSE
jgi:hypothetical protein